MSRKKRPEPKSQAEQILELEKQLAHCTEERDGYAVKCSTLALQLKMLDAKRSKEGIRFRKAMHELSKEKEQQTSIKNFRAGQADVLLATVHMLEEVLKQYADTSSWSAADPGSPDIQDKFTCLEVTHSADDVDAISTKQMSGWELAQKALSHELLQVG